VTTDLTSYYDVMIAGQGAAGFAAALYSARYQMKTVVLGETFGGETATGGNIENYPGFAEIDGFELMMKFREQVEGYDVPIVAENVGAIRNPKAIEGAVSDLSMITGQRPAVRRAKKSVSNFKLRSGMPIGCMVTLRSKRMYEFLDRFLTVAIPRIRDFRGLSLNSFDGRGNYSVGIQEQIIFPEIDYDAIDEVRGLDVTIVTSAKTDEEAFELLKGFGTPFQTVEAA
jgi:large subunit ribosomal protein L5